MLILIFQHKFVIHIIGIEILHVQMHLCRKVIFSLSINAFEHKISVQNNLCINNLRSQIKKTTMCTLPYD